MTWITSQKCAHSEEFKNMYIKCCGKYFNDELTTKEYDKMKEVLYKYFDLVAFMGLLDELSFKERVYFGSISLICIFIVRGLFIFLINSYGYYLKYKITMSNSKKLYLSYLSRPYKFHINNNASNLAQNMSDSLKSTVVVMAYANIIKDIILLTFIFFVIYITTPSEFLKIILFTITPALILFIIIIDENILENTYNCKVFNK